MCARSLNSRRQPHILSFFYSYCSMRQTRGCGARRLERVAPWFQESNTSRPKRAMRLLQSVGSEGVPRLLDHGDLELTQLCLTCRVHHLSDETIRDRLVGDDRRQLSLVLLASLPAAAAGIPLKLLDWDERLYDVRLSSALLMVTGVVLLIGGRASHSQPVVAEVSKLLIR